MSLPEVAAIYSVPVLPYIIYNYIRYFLSFKHMGGIFINWTGFDFQISLQLLKIHNLENFQSINRKFNRKTILNPC